MNNQTMVFWHGGDLSDIDNTFRQQTKKQEYGPGLYLTTSYNVVKDYVKGSRKLYRVEVSLGNSLEDAEIPYEKVMEFLNKLPKQVSIKIKSSIDKYNRNGFVNAEIINNLFVNYNLLKPEISYKLKEFYLENNIDYSLVNNAFGWGEDMMVLFNTNRIVNVERIGPKDKIDKFELHKESVESNKKCSDIKLTDEMKNEMSKFNSDEEFLRKGGFSIEALDRAAFGFSSEDIKTLKPNQLNIKWKDDYENVIYEQNKSGLSKIDWANKINLNEPIDVIFEKNKFFIDDGHHRFYAAKILNKPLNVNLIIKQNPIIYLNKDLSYDDFHRCAFSIFKKQTQLQEMEVSKKDLIQNWLNNPKKLKEDAEDANFIDEITKAELEEAKKARTKLRKKSKGDRCTRIAKRKYDVWPSAYASGAVVKCRQGKIWKGLNEEDESDIQEPEYALIEITKALAYMDDKYRYQLIPKSKLDNRLIDIKKGASGYKSISPNNIKVIETGNKAQLETKLKELQNKSLDEKTDFSKEKSKGLHGWFERQGGKGKSKGWVDCNTCRTVDGKKKCKTCGRQEGEKRAKYPACRPTPSACGTKGKGKSWGKKSKLNEGTEYLRPEEINEVLKGYIEAALWTEEERLKDDYNEIQKSTSFTNDDEDDELSEIDKLVKLSNNLNQKTFENFTREDIEPDSLIKAYTDIKEFIKLAGDSVYEAIYENGLERLGIDIWFTRNGHGSGFFDHSYDDEDEKKLIEAGKSLGSVDLYINDNLKLSFSNQHLHEQSKQDIEREMKLNEIKEYFRRHIGKL
jgi:hypothetical protein